MHRAHDASQEGSRIVGLVLIWSVAHLVVDGGDHDLGCLSGALDLQEGVLVIFAFLASSAEVEVRAHLHLYRTPMIGAMPQPSHLTPLCYSAG
jgi:hypothetical protein